MERGARIMRASNTTAAINTRYKTEFGDDDTCVPQIAIKADGNEYRVNSSLYYGAPYADIESVREVNDHSIEITDKVSGKVVGINKLSASDDGKTLTTDWRTIFDNGKESGGKFDSERVGGAPAGANKVSCE